MPPRRRRRPRALAVAVVSAAAVLGLGASSALALTPSSTPTGEWSAVGGQVNAVVRSGGAVYLGGSFQGLARRAPGIAAFDPDSGELAGPTAQLDPLPSTPIKVTAVTAAADGGVYIAGNFVGAGGVRQQRLLRFTSSGALDRAFKPDVQGATEIVDMAVGANGVLYMAGTFATVGGQARTTLAAVDATTGALNGWHPSTVGIVTQLEAGPSAIYLGGEFSQVGGVARSRAAAVGLVDGAVLPWKPEPNDPVRALALDGSTVYLGGEFTKLQGADRFRLAAVDAGGAGALRAWNPAPSAPVTRLVVAGTRVYAAGSFERIGAQATQPTHRFLAAIDATSGDALAWDPLANRAPSDIAVAGGRVYLAWTSGAAEPEPKLADQFRCGLASVDATTAVATPWDPSVETDDTVSGNCNPTASYRAGAQSLAITGGRVWAGGTFGVANIRRRGGLAALDATTGEPLPWAPALGDVSSAAEFVKDLAPSADGATIYVGGRFTKINGQTRLNAAAISTAGTASSPADLRSWDPAPQGGSAPVVRALALSPDGKLVVLGGNFTKAGAPSRDRINLAAVDATTAAAQAWRPNPGGGNVRDLLVDPAAQRLYVAGSFTAITATSTDVATPDRVNRAGLAAVDLAATPAPAVLPWDAGLAADAQVEALAIRGTQLVAGGQFAAPGDGPANLAAFDLATAAVQPWHPQVDRRVSTVRIDPADASAYITGEFTTVGGEPRSGAAAVGADGLATGWDPSPGANYPNTSIAERPPGGVVLLDDRVLLTGPFTTIGGRRQAGLAFFGPASAPVPVSPPKVTGTPKLGEAPLSCVAAVWAGDRGTLTIAWLRDDAAIPGQTARKYTIVAADRGHVLRCRETMGNAAASVAQVSDPTATVTGLPPELESPPAVGGAVFVGGGAQCTTGLWRNSPSEYRYRWLLDDAAIDGETAPTYVVRAGEQGHALGCEVTAANADGASPPARSESVTIAEAPPAALGVPLITGDARVAGSLTCVPGPFERARAFAYQWLRDRVAIVGAADPTFVPTSRDLGRALTCLVTASNDGGSISVESGAVAIAASPHSVGTGRAANPPDDDTPSGAARARRIAVRSVRLRTASTLAVAVSAPSSGRIGVTVVRGAATTLARGSRTVRRATAATLSLRLSAATRRLIAHAGKRGVRVTVRVSFKPTRKGSATTTARRTATLTRPASTRATRSAGA